MFSCLLISKTGAVADHELLKMFPRQAPRGDKVLTEVGLDIVEVKDGKITRNEVYFDTRHFQN